MGNAIARGVVRFLRMYVSILLRLSCQGVASFPH